MSVNGALLEYLKEGVENLLDAGQFENGREFRPTQKAALEAYQKYLNKNYLKPEDKLKGFFDMPTGIGKTALFSGILSETHKAASRYNDHLKSIIVVPTVTLLGQIQQDLKDFAPPFANRIGLYGDGHKNLHNQITIMTYDAWYDLSAAGKIGSHNVDILISDEAHKGTSERRIENILNQYDDKQTAKIAFSATPHFDETKSVYATHGRQIFYRSIRDAVLSGELASYVQSHRAVIRAMPTEHMITQEFSEAAFAAKAQYRKRLRQEAWNKFAIKIFREGVDEYTGDPLSDNQTGFFVDDTTQADNLAKMLNSDEALQAKAKALGMSDVAVSIHSKKRGRKHLLSEYKAGKYMAIIGDEMFKEGFNHPPMKTIIDYAHGSVVDKGQILGRGAREWWNEKKGRYEGLVVIDTVAFIGSKIPTENMRLREDALRRAVSVKGILEDSYILGPKANISLQNDPSKSSKLPLGSIFNPKVSESSKNNTSPTLHKPRPNIFWDNPDIEYYAHTTEVYQLDAEIAEIRREHWVEITDDILEELHSEFERADLSPYKLIKIADNKPPEKLKSSSISNWLQRGGFAEPSHLDWVLQELKKRPSYMRMTPEFIDHIKGEVAARNASFKSIGKRSRYMSNIEKALSHFCMLKSYDVKEYMSEFFTGNIKSKSMPELFVRWAYGTLSDMPLIDSTIVQVSAREKETFKNLIAAKETSASRVSDQVKSFPGKLSKSKFRSLLLGKVEQIEKGYLTWSFEKVRGYESNSNLHSISNNHDAIMQKLQKEEHGYYEKMSAHLSKGIPGFLPPQETRISSYILTKEERENIARNMFNGYKDGDLETDDDLDYIVPKTGLKISIETESNSKQNIHAEFQDHEGNNPGYIGDSPV